ncbi:MAG: hypothetical protein ACRCX8_08625 [Sarcina sp.]
MNINEAIIKAKNKEIPYPELRQGEAFVGKEIFLSLHKAENDSIIDRSKLHTNLETALQHYKFLNLKGSYYVYFDMCKTPGEWKIDLEF